MKVYCKRTYFEKNTNAFPVNGKEYGQDYVKWAWGKIYECREPEGYERGGHTDMFPGIYLYIESEIKDTACPIKEKEFKRHFETLEENRDRKLEQILNND